MLADRDQDAVDRLSDLSGPLRPGELFDPYLTAYPLPSEKYYVLARTFQDLTAARSGCVRTSSVLIPMKDWDVVESLDGLLQELVCLDANGVAVQREVSTEKLEPPEEVAHTSVVELVDAVFVDGRPVVFFDCTGSEAIAIRLILALWPSTRRKFSVCTFALGPRMSENGFFDLVFAPISARSRFTGYGHRRVSGTQRSRTQRGGVDCHWAEPVALHIFRSDDPSLLGLDSAGLLRLEQSGDRASLRVVSLWNELALRANKTPTAVLGLLDIVRSREMTRVEAWWPDLEETVLKAIASAARELPYWGGVGVSVCTGGQSRSRLDVESGAAADSRRRVRACAP